MAGSGTKQQQITKETSIMAFVMSMTHITELAPSGSNRAVAIGGSVRIPTVLESISADRMKLLPEKKKMSLFISCWGRAIYLPTADS